MIPPLKDERQLRVSYLAAGGISGAEEANSDPLFDSGKARLLFFGVFTISSRSSLPGNPSLSSVALKFRSLSIFLLAKQYMEVNQTEPNPFIFKMCSTCVLEKIVGN